MDNSKVSTNPDGNATLWNSGENRYACADTTDKIFLLSEKEATTTEYDFSGYAENGTGSTRIRVATDYAKATELPVFSNSAGRWWLRSPYYNNDGSARIGDSDGNGNTDDFSNVWSTSVGVVPALCVQLQ